MTPDLTFVVETLNLRDEHDFSPLDASLAALRAQSIDPSRYEIIVVVDPDAEPALERHLAENWPGVRYLAAPGAHYYAMKNAGARAALGRIVGYVDADCIVSPGWATAMIEALDGNTSASCAVGRYDTHDSDTSAFAQAFLVSLFGHQCGRAHRDITSIAASNCALRRDDVTAEPWHEQPYFHGPDVEKASSITERGGRIVAVPAAESRHDHEPGLAAQHGRGVYWGYCFLRLRREATSDVPFGRLFSRLGPLAPLAVVPAKAAIDLRRLAERRRDLGLSLLQTARVAGLLVLNSLSCGVGAMRCFAGLPPPRTPQNTHFGGHRDARPAAS
jgi:glycosyltransferase involved in cell wall biosynthesis